MTAIKKSGVVVKDNKWLSTGVSKDGTTTIFYAYYYPNDVDAYVPFSAPLTPSLEDERPYNYICSPVALGDRYEKVRTAFLAVFSNKNLQAELVKLLKGSNPSTNYTDEYIRLWIFRKMLLNHFQNALNVDNHQFKS